MDKKKQILQQLEALPLEQIDKKLSEFRIEKRQIDHQYYLLKDEKLNLKGEKGNNLMKEGNSLSKTERLLRWDGELRDLESQLIRLKDARNKFSFLIEIYSTYYWKAKN